MGTSPVRHRSSLNASRRVVHSIVLAALLSLGLVAATAVQGDEATVGAQGVLYVDAGVSGGTGDGSSWSNAFNGLQDAIDRALPGSQVWVAAGAYTPSSWPNDGSPDDRTVHFSLKNGVDVYGGFTGAEGVLEERDWELNITVLTGDVGVVGGSSDNCYHVFFHPEGTNLEAGAVLDGFTITLGNANGLGVSGAGGGMYNFESAPTLNNVVFAGNMADEGGGLFNDMSSPTLTNCTIGPNLADDGGGMFNDYFSAPMLVDCSLIGNTAVWNGGGVLNDYFSAPTMVNCTASGNLAGWNGGGMLNYNSSAPVLTGCTIVDNFAWQGGGMYNYYAAPVMVNTVLRDNRAFSAGNQVYNLYARPTVLD